MTQAKCESENEVKEEWKSEEDENERKEKRRKDTVNDEDDAENRI